MAEPRAMLPSLMSLIPWTTLSGPATLAPGNLLPPDKTRRKGPDASKEKGLGLCPSFTSNLPPNQTAASFKAEIPFSPPLHLHPIYKCH